MSSRILGRGRKRADEEPIIIVSGLPRSGTSLMMQMLDAAGVPILCDAARAADEDNPRGYFELEAVKRIRDDVRFLDGAGGHAVKVVAPLIRYLPANRPYRVLLMCRDLDEVMKSQAKMLGRGGASGAPAGAEGALRDAFLKSVERARSWIRATPDVSCLEVSHADLLRNPVAVAEDVCRFLGLVSDSERDSAAMARIVDPELHRSR